MDGALAPVIASCIAADEAERLEHRESEQQASPRRAAHGLNAR